jgi:hypothetical protein
MSGDLVECRSKIRVLRLGLFQVTSCVSLSWALIFIIDVKIVEIVLGKMQAASSPPPQDNMLQILRYF